MSSNIEVQRICQLCGKEFTARTTVTRYCSSECSSRAYKQRIRENKIETSNNEQFIKPDSILPPTLSNMDFLSVPIAAGLFGVSRFTIYRYLRDNMIKGIKLRGKTFIRRKDIETIFDNAGDYEPKPQKERQPITEFYTIAEIMERYKCKESWAYKLIKEGGIPKTTHRGRTLYSKSHVDKAFARKQQDASITEWYGTDEIRERFGMTDTAIYSLAYERNIPKRKDGRNVFYSKPHFDAAKGITAPVTPAYYSTTEAMSKYHLTRDSLYHILKTHGVPKIKEGRIIKISKPELDKIFEKPIIL